MGMKFSRTGSRVELKVALTGAASFGLAAGLLLATPAAQAAPAATGPGNQPSEPANNSQTATQNTTRPGPRVKASRKTATAIGKVTGGRGMRLISVDSNGRAVVRVLPPSGKFRIPVGTDSSLNLTTADGSFFGPVVLRGNGKKGLPNKTLDFIFFNLGKQRTINLGKISLRSGWAAGKKPLNSRLVKGTAAQAAQANRGTPIGSGKSGRVAVPASQVRAVANNPAIDLDRDGIIGAFDVDDSGNLKLDNVDNATVKGSVRSAHEPSLAAAGFWMFSNYKATDPNFADVINANVKIPSTAELDASTRSKLGLAVQVVPGATLGCTGQVYCPTSPMAITAGPSGDFQWRLADTYPSLTAADVNAGDTFVETSSDGTAYAGVLNFVFRTTPALTSYQLLNPDGSEAAAAVDVDYSANPAGSVGNRIRVSDNKLVKLTFWRPQRQAFEGETGGVGGYVDIGNLQYMADNPNSGGGGCPATAGDSDGATVPDGTWTNVQDTLDDTATDPARTLSMIVDPTSCAGGRIDSDLDIQAKSRYSDNSAQKIYFQIAQRQG